MSILANAQLSEDVILAARQNLNLSKYKTSQNPFMIAYTPYYAEA